MKTFGTRTASNPVPLSLCTVFITNSKSSTGNTEINELCHLQASAGARDVCLGTTSLFNPKSERADSASEKASDVGPFGAVTNHSNAGPSLHSPSMPLAPDLEHSLERRSEAPPLARTSEGLKKFTFDDVIRIAQERQQNKVLKIQVCCCCL